MVKYTQLTQELRYQIYAYLKAGFSKSHIACEIGVHKSTIYREIKRNCGKRGYRPRQANLKAVKRRKSSLKHVKMTPEVIKLTENFIRQDFSPDQISGYLAKRYDIKISHETIYQYIMADKAKGGNLYTHLRQGYKKRKKRYGSYNPRSQIKNRVSIDDRPAIVAARKRVGDWEIDTIIGKNSKGALLTLVERKSKFALIKKVQQKQADLVAEAAIDLLSPYKKNVLTITSDNGREFAQHEYIKERIKADIYFAHPHHSWERGLCENTNGLIRQYFPRGTDFQTIKEDHVRMATSRLNNRPRKTLGYKTPKEVFFHEITKQAA